MFVQVPALVIGYNNTRQGAIGFSGASYIPVMNAVPATLATNNIAASQTPVAGTALTLVSTTGAGVNVLATALLVFPAQVTIPAATLCLDTAPAVVAFGTPSISNGYTMVSLYDPSTMVARAVRIVSAGNDTSATFAVVGYDVYGYAMSETITGANGTATGKKAFKFITSITPAGTLSGSAVTVGTTDVIGLPLRSDYVSDLSINMADAAITASTGYVAADTTTATATTGDVRGTYLLQTASDGSRRLRISITPPVGNIGSPVSGLFGVTQA